MKIFSAYCLLITFAFGLWAGRPMLSDQGILAPPATHSCSAEAPKAAETHGKCCQKQKEAEKKSCSHAQDEKDDCCRTNCTRTCCSMVTGFLSNPQSFTAPLAGVLRNFALHQPGSLPNPYLGKITPPPNLC